MKAAWLALALAACAADPTPAGPETTSFVEIKDIPMYANTQLDVLFVIDDSAAMAPLQTKLAGDYRRMIESIATTSFGEPPDLHVGVVTADLADQGRMRQARFLEDSPRFAWQRVRNYDGTLGDQFADLANVGTTGASDMQPRHRAADQISPEHHPFPEPRLLRMSR